MAKVKKSVSLDEEIIKSVEDAGTETGRSFSNYINEVLRQHFEEGSK